VSFTLLVLLCVPTERLSAMVNHVWLQLVATVLGRRCTGLQNLRNDSKAQIHSIVPPAGATERLLTIEGTVEQIQRALYLVQKRSDQCVVLHTVTDNQ